MTNNTLQSKHQALVNLLRAVKNTDYAFTTITPVSHAIVNSRRENTWAKNAESAAVFKYSQHRILREIFGWNRPFYQIDIEPDIFDLMREAHVLKPYADGWKSTVRISTVQSNHFGTQFFLHSAFPTTDVDSVFFGPDTYRYLREIQTQIASATDVKRAVDIGAGAGPGAIWLALQHPNAEVYAIDINDKALEFTMINAEVAGANNVKPLTSDLLTAVEGEFDLITANPPYLVDKDQRAYRHGGGDYGAGLSHDIIQKALPRLSANGILLLYTGVAIIDGVDVFKERTTAYLQSLPKGQILDWSYQEIDPDIFGEELINPSYAEAERLAAIVLKVRNGLSGMDRLAFEYIE
jgi:methylase of polypeptide subunit release factors